MHHWIDNRPQVVATVLASLKEEVLEVWTCLEPADFLSDIAEELASNRGRGS